MQLFKTAETPSGDVDEKASYVLVDFDSWIVYEQPQFLDFVDGV